jgi:DNA-binding PadR family transcriptional regulator
MWHFGMHGGKRRGLRVWVLMMLKRKPKNGAELMDEMESLSQGWWRPSPGSVYPLLEELAKEGTIERRPDGRYALTAKAEEELGWMGVPWGGHGGGTTAEGALREIGAQLSYVEDALSTSPELLGPSRTSLEELSRRLDTLLKKA